MKLFVFACLVAAVVAAPPASPSAGATVLRYDNDNIGTGDYKFAYEQDDGIKASASGELQNGNSENAYIAVKGNFEWIGPDGVTYTVIYTADQNGYNPQITQGAGGAIPDEVVKSFKGQ